MVVESDEIINWRKKYETPADLTELRSRLKGQWCSLTNCSTFHDGYLTYGIGGAFFFSPLFSPDSRHVWSGIVALIFSTTILSAGTYAVKTITDENYHPDRSSVFVLIEGVVGFPLYLTLAFINWYFRDALEISLLQNYDRQTEIDTLPGSDIWKIADKRRHFLWILINCFFATSVLSFIGYVLFVVKNEEAFKEEEFQFFPHPFTPFLRTKLEFVFVTIIFSSSEWLLINVGHADAQLMVIIAQEYYMAMIPLWHRMDKFSRDSAVSFKNLLETISQEQLSDQSKLVEAERLRLTENLKSTILFYRKFLKRMEKITFYLEFKYTFTLLAVIMTMFSATTGLYSDNFPLLRKARAANILIGITINWFYFCYPGKVLKDLADTMNEKVSNIPWYYLDPRRRKDYSTFLQISQQPIILRDFIFRIYEQGMPIFMTIVRLNYTYFNFLRGIK